MSWWGHFAAAEAQRHLDLVAFLEKAAHGLHLGVVIVVVDARPQLDFLDLDDLLAAPLLGGLLLFEEAEFPVIEDLADWRIGVRNDLDEVEPRVLGDLHRGQGLGDAAVLTFGIDELNFADSYLLVGARPVLLRGRRGFHGTANGDLLVLLMGVLTTPARRRGAMLRPRAGPSQKIGSSGRKVNKGRPMLSSGAQVRPLPATWRYSNTARRSSSAA